MRWLPASLLLVALLAGCGPEAGSVPSYKFGQLVQTGPLLYSVDDARWSLTLGSPPDERTASNRFYLVHVKVQNCGAMDSFVPTLKLVDDSGQSFNEVTNGAGVNDWLGIVRKIDPVRSVSGTAIFDVAPGHYKLRVADDADQIPAFIDLPAAPTVEPKTQGGQ